MYIPVRHKEIPLIQEKLQLKPDDVLVDIGGGTGWMTHRLWKAAGLKEPALCVDPSAAMLEKAKELEGVSPVLATAEQFFADSQENSVSKVLIAGCIHHCSDHKALFEDMAKSLSPGGSCVILLHSKWLVFPGEVYSSLDAITEESLTASLEEAGFCVDTDTQVLRYELSKVHWYSALRNRILSYLEHFSDEQIEEGIQAFEKKFVGADQPLTIEISVMCFSVQKNN